MLPCLRLLFHISRAMFANVIFGLVDEVNSLSREELVFALFLVFNTIDFIIGQITFQIVLSVGSRRQEFWV